MVAEEIKHLAEQSRRRANEIETMVDQTATNATEITNETQDISSAVRQQNQMVLTVSESIQNLLNRDTDLLN